MTLPTLQYGASGSDVKKLQTLLNENGANLDADGKFGAKTEAAVKRFQELHGLTADGIVGRKTWAALGETNPQDGERPDSGVIPVQAADLEKAYRQAKDAADTLRALLDKRTG